MCAVSSYNDRVCTENAIFVRLFMYFLVVFGNSTTQNKIVFLSFDFSECEYCFCPA